MATRIQYWILLSDGNAWMDVSVRDIQELMAHGFTPVIRITQD